MTSTERALIAVLLAAMAILAVLAVFRPARTVDHTPDYSQCELIWNAEHTDHWYECPAP